MDQLFYGIENIISLIYKNSYIFTNITMMVSFFNLINDFANKKNNNLQTWSIMYHSWLTFVFLLLGNILWMIPNQRKAMLRTSPFIVFYAIFLLIAQYIYSMNLTEDELPTRVAAKGINLAQIGFIRYSHLPIKTILLKSLFSVMFWITLRQMFQERRMAKQKSTLADMVAPLQVTVGAATADLAPQAEGKKSSEFMTKAGIFLNSLLVKVWIWIVLVVIFVSGMVGTRMTGFRIAYMALFLVFMLFFQVSVVDEFRWKEY